MSALLLVDADISSRASTKQALQAAGHHCDAAGSIVEARARLARTPAVDAIVLGVDGPAEDGVDLVRSVTASTPDTAVVVVAAVGDHAAVDAALSAGIDVCLVGPVEPSTLCAAVSRALDRVRLQQERAAETKRLRALLDDRDVALSRIKSTLRLRDSQITSLISSVPVGVLFSTVEGGCEYSNDEAQRLTGLDLDAFLGTGWLRIVHPDDQGLVLFELEQCRQRDQRRLFEHRLIHADGTEMRVSTRLGPVHDRHGNSVGYVATIEDITAQKRAEQDLEWQATHDPLTGLPNRTMINRRVEDLVAEGTGSVLLIDLDSFKMVNDIHGHGAGDSLLVDVARELDAEFGEGYTVGRFGGDEFVIVADTDRDEAGAMSERVLAALSRAGDETALPVTASVGVAEVMAGTTADEPIRRADIAMYRAKTTGGSRHQVFTTALSDRLVERIGLEKELRQAVREGQLEVYYQPEVDCRTGRLQRVESLIRWPHPERDLLLPGLFLPLAVELEGDAFFPMLTAALDDYGVDPELVTIEVTEGSLMRDLGNSAFRLDAICDLGVRISLDDFGTGYSSLSYLNDLPLDQLKIDRSFIQRLGGHSASDSPGMMKRHQLAEAVVYIAHIFQLEVVAEGVEEEAHYSAVAGLGCDLAQGFLIAPPAPHDDTRLRRLVMGAPFEPAESARQEPAEQLSS
ncbi:MAG: EAL domain-containing protein [Actinomycetota bacterium]|nr:EAL domain-containing protein [Actinomycetota bacterium]